MDGLRWLLLLFGVLVIAGVYWYSRREATKPRAPRPERRREPQLAAELEEDEAAAEADAENDEPAATQPEKIVTLRLVAVRGGTFPGDQLALALRGVGMRHGRFGIFHQYDGEDENRVVYSAASLVEPGNFDLANLKEQRFPGISLFMILPGPLDGAEAFDRMMAAARGLTKALGGELLDESGSTLSIQRERYLREEIIQYQLGIKVA